MAVLTKIVRQITGDLSDNSGGGLSGTSWVRSADATDILPSDLTNGNKYLIIAHGLWWSGSDNEKSGMRFVTIDANRDVVNANAFPDSWRDQEFSYSSAFSYSWMTVWTCDGFGIGIQLLPDPANAGHSVTLRHHTLTAIDITGLTENTDYYYSTASGLQATESTGVGTAYDTIVHNPPENTDWLFLGYSRCRTDSTSARPEVRWGEFGGTVMTEMRYSNEGENLADTLGLGTYDHLAAVCAQVLSYGASPGSQTEHASYQRRENPISPNDTGLSGIVNSSMFLLNLNLFSYYKEVNTRSGTSSEFIAATDADPYPSASQPIETLDLTPDNPNVNSLIIGQWCMNTNKTGNWYYAKWQDKANADYRSPAGAESPPLGNFPRISSGHDGGTSGNWFSTVPDPSTLTGDIGWRQLGGSGGNSGGAGFQHTMMLVLALDTASSVLPITLTAASTTDASTSTVKRVTDISMTAASTTDASTARATAVRGITHTGASTTDASTATIDTFKLITLSAVSTTDAGTADVDLIRPITLAGASTTDAATAVVTQLKPITFTAASTTDASTVTVDTGGEVAPTPWFGTKVRERHFQRPDRWTVALAENELSGVAYNEFRDQLITVSDGPARWNRHNATTGAIVNSETDLNLGDATTPVWTPDGATVPDVEGIVWLGTNYPGPGGPTDSDWYAILHEGTSTTGNAPGRPTIGIVHLPPGTLSIVDGDITEHVLTSLPATLTGLPGGVNNAGFEALTYDTVNDLFYVGAQSLRTADVAGQYGLWKVDPNNGWAQTFLFAWGDTINEGGTGLSGIGVDDGAVVADIQSGTSFAGDCIFVATRGGDVPNQFPNRRIYQLDLTTGNEGNIVSWMDYGHWAQGADGDQIGNYAGTGRNVQTEGFCMSSDGLTMYQCRERGTGGDAHNVFRSQAADFPNNTFNAIEIHDDGWYYWDRLSGSPSLFDRSPDWRQTSFDIGGSANMFGPNRAAFARTAEGGIEGTHPTQGANGWRASLDTINTEIEDHNGGNNVTPNENLSIYLVKDVFIPEGTLKSVTIRSYPDDAHCWYVNGTEVFRTQRFYNPIGQETPGTPISLGDQVGSIDAKATTDEGTEENNTGLDNYSNSDERTLTAVLDAFTPGTYHRIAIYGASNTTSSSDFIFDGQLELEFYVPLTLNAASTTDAATVTVDATSVNLLPITLSAASTTDAATVEVDNIRPIVLAGASTTDASTATVTRVEPITLAGASTTDASTVEVDNLRQITLSAVSTTDASTVLLTRLFGITHSAVSTTDASTVLLTRRFAVTLSAVSDTEAALVRLTRGFDITMLGASTTDASTATVTALRGITLSAPSTTDASTAEVDKTIPITLSGSSTTDASTVSLTRGLNITLAADSTTDATTVLLTVGRPITLLGDSETDASTVLVSRQANLTLAADSTTDASTVEIDRVIAITLAANSTTDCSEARVSQVVGITLAANSTTDASTATLTRLFGITFSAISDTDCSTATVSTGLNLSLFAVSTTDASSILVRRDLAVTLAAASTTDAATIDLDIGKFIVLTANSTTDASSIAVTFGITMAADSTTDASTAEIDAIRPITLSAASTTDASSIGIVRQYQLSAVSTTDASEALVTTLFGISLAAASTTDASTARATAVRPITLAAASTTDASTVGLTVGQTINIMLLANSTTDASTALVTRGLDITLSAASTTDASTVPITERKQVLDDVSAAIVDTIGQVSVNATVLETPVIVDQPGESVRTGTVLDTLTILDTPIKTDMDIVEIELMPSRTPRGWFQTKQGGEQWTVFEHRTSLTDPLVGKTIFRKAVDFGALPNTTLKSVAHGITDIDVNGWVRINGIVRGGNESEELSGAQNVTRVLVDSGTVKITTDADLSGKTAVVLLEYTKS